MIRRSPCEYYIKYLLVHPDAFSLDDIQITLREHQLDYPGDIVIRRLRQRLKTPTTFRPYDERHGPTFRFLVQEGIYFLFHPDKHTKAAIYLLGRARAKEMIEAMSISGDPPSLICRRLRGIGYDVTEKDLSKYYCFFWNLELVDRLELNALLRMRVERMLDDGDDAISRAMHRAMKTASYNDPRTAAINSPVSPFAGVLNQMRYGFRPESIDIASLLQAAKEIAAIRIAEEALARGPNAAQITRDFSSALYNLYNLSDSVGSPDDELQRNIMNLVLETDGTKVPYVHELTEGKHTTDVQPTDKHAVE